MSINIYLVHSYYLSDGFSATCQFLSKQNCRLLTEQQGHFFNEYCNFWALSPSQSFFVFVSFRFINFWIGKYHFFLIKYYVILQFPNCQCLIKQIRITYITLFSIHLTNSDTMRKYLLVLASCYLPKPNSLINSRKCNA